ncbi:hypothetical protein evm_014646, partial [Chilo suppressalis]
TRFLYWLPLYINTSTSLTPRESGLLSTVFDVGGAAGAILAGLLADRSASPATVCGGAFLLLRRLRGASTKRNTRAGLLADRSAQPRTVCGAFYLLGAPAIFSIENDIYGGHSLSHIYSAIWKAAASLYESIVMNSQSGEPMPTHNCVLCIRTRFVYRTIKRYNEDSSVDDRSRSGRPRSVRTPAVIKAVKARIQRNPKRKQKLLALQMGLSRTTVKRLLNEDLGLRAYRRKTGHRLNARVIDLRLKRCRVLLKRYAGKIYREILFSDEKIFTVEESYNKQNDKLYVHSSKEASNRIPRVQRGHFPSSLSSPRMGVSYWGLTKVHFCEKGVKTNAVVYQNTVLMNLVEAVSHTMFNNRHWVFQQESASAHRAKSTQDWLAAREIDFIRHEDWRASPDLSPLHYKIWQHLEEKACSKPHPNLESLKTSLIKAAADIDMDLVHRDVKVIEWSRGRDR